MLVRAFIALPYFFDFDDSNLAVPVKQNPVVADSEAISVVMARQRLYVLTIGHRGQGVYSVADCNLMLPVELA